jgi:hypothetical protein
MGLIGGFNGFSGRGGVGYRLYSFKFKYNDSLSQPEFEEYFYDNLVVFKDDGFDAEFTNITTTDLQLISPLFINRDKIAIELFWQDIVEPSPVEGGLVGYTYEDTGEIFAVITTTNLGGMPTNGLGILVNIKVYD